MTNTIYLEKIGIEVPLPGGVDVRYYDDGAVNNYFLYRIRAERPPLKRVLKTIKQSLLDRQANGLCVVTRVVAVDNEELMGLTLRTSYRSGMNELHTEFVRGHEEAHALEALVGEKAMLDMLNNAASKVNLEFTNVPISDEEQRVDQGGVLALKRRLDRCDFSPETKIEKFEKTIKTKDPDLFLGEDYVINVGFEGLFFKVVDNA